MQEAKKAKAWQANSNPNGDNPRQNKRLDRRGRGTINRDQQDWTREDSKRRTF